MNESVVFTGTDKPKSRRLINPFRYQPTLNLLDNIVNTTKEYMDSKTKAERKKLGQFFTSKNTAIFMASLFQLNNLDNITVLDPGAGSGILSAALLERIFREHPHASVKLVCYEIDPDILVLLHANLLSINRALAAYRFSYEIREENYITTQKSEFNEELLIWNKTLVKYVYIISNPPYKKVAKDAAEAKSMTAVCYGAPNLYFLFMAMSIFNLTDQGEMVYIIPRSWTSGQYFRTFREYLFENGSLTNVHLFQSRSKVFDTESVLQETIVIRYVKDKITDNHIRFSSSFQNGDISSRQYLDLPQDEVVVGKDKYLLIINTPEERKAVGLIRSQSETLKSLGLQMKTGLLIGFRNLTMFTEKTSGDAVPVFYSFNIENGFVYFDESRENAFICNSQQGLLQENKNYLFVKRFTTKEEQRRLQAGIYLKSNFPRFSEISTDNKINFIDIPSHYGDSIVYGLYALFNSTIYDTYYRVLNGSTQVNSSEMNAIPVPDINTIMSIGDELQKKDDVSTATCDSILEAYL